MKFLFLIYHDEKTLDTLPDGEMQGLVDSALDYSEKIRQSGHYIFCYWRMRRSHI